MTSDLPPSAMGDLNDPSMRNQNAAAQSSTKAQDRSSVLQLKLMGQNRSNSPDPPLRRRRRIRVEGDIALILPDEDARAEILSASLRESEVIIDGDFDKKKIARLTPGFVRSDLEGLIDMAGPIALERVIDARKSRLSAIGEKDPRAWLEKNPFTQEEEDKLLCVKMSDFEEAVKACKAQAREGFAEVPDVKWDDVGGHEPVRVKLNRYIIRPILMPDIYKEYGANLQTGVLLYGPPGCGKKLIAKAAANEAGASFIYIKASELVSKYGGESELDIREMFQRAQKCSPCIIYFDEVDAMTRATWEAAGVLSQFLSELDGGGRSDVFVIGSTNRPGVLEPALLRPDRFSNLVYVPVPDAAQRFSILKAIARKKCIDPAVHLDSIANRCHNFTRADLLYLVDKAIFIAINESFEEDGKGMIKMTHFEQALSFVAPSMTEENIKLYEEESKKLQPRGGMF